MNAQHKNYKKSLCTCLHHMVILRTRNKITDFLMILAWASPFKTWIKIKKCPKYVFVKYPPPKSGKNLVLLLHATTINVK